MNHLPLPDQRFLDAAEGWLGLGEPAEAIVNLVELYVFLCDPASLPRIDKNMIGDTWLSGRDAKGVDV